MACSIIQTIVIKAISPYAAADAGMIVVVLRHLADEMESKNVGAKEFAEWLDEHTKKPPLTGNTGSQEAKYAVGGQHGNKCNWRSIVYAGR